MLKPEDRQKLDGIVIKMSENNESPADIQFVVNDFKKKYENQPITPQQVSQVGPKEKSFTEKIFSSENKTPMQNANIGIGKGVLSTLDNMSQVGQDVLQKVANPIVEKITGQEQTTENIALPSYTTEADGTAQSIGKGAEQIGEFFIPATLTAKLVKIGDVGIMGTKLATEFGKSGRMLAKSLSLATRSGLLAGEAASVTSLQTYGDEDSEEQTKMNAMLAGAVPIVGKVFEKGVKPVMTALGNKIQTSVIKPSVRDIKDGFNIHNVGKYEVGGSLDQMASRTHNAIEQRSKQLQNIIQDSDAKFDLNKAIDEVEAELSKSGTKTFGFNSKLGKAIQTFREEAALVAEDGVVSIPEAQQIKRSIGKIGAWEFGKKDPDSSALEEVANKLYTKVKEGIESISPENIKQINKELSELIPIENAVIRRIPVSERQNALSLSDVITVSSGLAHPGNWWLFVLNKMARSGTVGSVLEKGGRKLKEGGGTMKTLLFGPDKSSMLPSDIVAGKKLSTAIDSIGSRGGLSIQDVSKIPQKKSELTTKLLKDINGKAFVSKQYMLDATNRPELKQVEKDLIRDLLETEGDKIDVPAFTQKVEAELLPLKIRNNSEELFKTRGHDNIHTKALSRPKYENRALDDEIRGNVKDYAEHIYESPIKTAASGVHFNGETENYFGHTRVEDMAPEYKVGNTTYKSKSEAQIFGTPVEQPKTRRVIEVQSDLYQKGRLENEVKADYNAATALTKADRDERIALAGKMSSLDLNSVEYKEMKKRFDSLTSAARKKKASDISKLQQYNNPTAHFRMVREEIKRAADDGVEKLQFPTGKTGMKIEGLGGESQSWTRVIGGESTREFPLRAEQLKVGDTINQGASIDQWVITDVLGDGKFTAVPKRQAEMFEKDTGKRIADIPDELGEYPLDSEEFDISGKVDENNPIYKFYEKELGRYLKNKYKAELVTDRQGVTWMEVTIKPEHKGPVEAFGKARMDTILKGAVGTGALTAGVAGVNIAKSNSINGKTFENKKLNTIIADEKKTEPATTGGEDRTSDTTKTEYDSQVEKAAKKYKRIPSGFLKALIDQESSMGKNKANEGAVEGKFAWLVGFTEIAKKELEKNNIPFNLETEEGAIEAAAAYLDLKKDYRDKTGTVISTIEDLVDLYVDRYNANPKMDKEKLRSMFRKKLEKYV